MEAKAVGLWVRNLWKAQKYFLPFATALPLHAECSPCMHLISRSVIPTLLFISCEFFPLQSTDFTPPPMSPGKLLSRECPRFLKNVVSPWFILFLYCYLQFLIPVPLQPLLKQSPSQMGAFSAAPVKCGCVHRDCSLLVSILFLLFSREEVSLFPPLHHQPDFITIT